MKIFAPVSQVGVFVVVSAVLGGCGGPGLTEKVRTLPPPPPPAASNEVVFATSPTYDVLDWGPTRAGQVTRLPNPGHRDEFSALLSTPEGGSLPEDLLGGAAVSIIGNFDVMVTGPGLKPLSAETIVQYVDTDLRAFMARETQANFAVVRDLDLSKLRVAAQPPENEKEFALVKANVAFLSALPGAAVPDTLREAGRLAAQIEIASHLAAQETRNGANAGFGAQASLMVPTWQNQLAALAEVDRYAELSWQGTPVKVSINPGEEFSTRLMASNTGNMPLRGPVRVFDTLSGEESKLWTVSPSTLDIPKGESQEIQVARRANDSDPFSTTLTYRVEVESDYTRVSDVRYEMVVDIKDPPVREVPKRLIDPEQERRDRCARLKGDFQEGREVPPAALFGCAEEQERFGDFEPIDGSDVEWRWRRDKGDLGLEFRSNASEPRSITVRLRAEIAPAWAEDGTYHSSTRILSLQLTPGVPKVEVWSESLGTNWPTRVVAELD